MKSRILTWLGAGALLASTGLNVFLADRVGRGRGQCTQPSPAELQDCIDCLSLTPEQCDQLRAQSLSCCSIANSAEQDSDALLAELQQALHAEPVDEARVRELGNRLAQQRGALITAGVEAALRMRSVLTREQLAALAQQLGATGR